MQPKTNSSSDVSEDENFIELKFKDSPFKEIKADIEKSLKDNKIVIFIKGNPDIPQCGYSRFMVEVLRFYDVREFSYVDILQNDSIRSGMKEFSDWPTFP